MTLLDAFNNRKNIKSIKLCGRNSASKFTGKTKQNAIFGLLIELKHSNGKTGFEQHNSVCDVKLIYSGSSPVPFIVSQAMKY
jgi:hypothetical protein